jgi:hypothetical protein
MVINGKLQNINISLLSGKTSKHLYDKYFAALQLYAIHVISWLQIFCCSAAFLSGSAA